MDRPIGGSSLATLSGFPVCQRRTTLALSTVYGRKMRPVSISGTSIYARNTRETSITRVIGARNHTHVKHTRANHSRT